MISLALPVPSPIWNRSSKGRRSRHHRESLALGNGRRFGKEAKSKSMSRTEAAEFARARTAWIGGE
jgi:hypothetical protein